jgi:hypothetical protein
VRLTPAAYSNRSIEILAPLDDYGVHRFARDAIWPHRTATHPGLAMSAVTPRAEAGRPESRECDIRELERRIEAVRKGLLILAREVGEISLRQKATKRCRS